MVGGPGWGRTHRLAGDTSARVAGAVGAQLSQALASFVLQVLAARLLGASGLGTFALLYGGTIIGTALCTGLVGDSLTVLDRNDPHIRAGLQKLCALVSALAGALACLLTWATHLLSPGAALLFGAATFVFIVEDALRRMLMATMRFWSLPLVDVTSLVASVAVLAGARASHLHIGVGQFMLALLVGQLVASAVAVARLPRSERWLARTRPAAMRAVFEFGGWRSAQQGVRPSMLTAARLIVTVGAGAAIYGHLEAARVYMAPALLVVNGIGSFLLPMYARRRAEPIGRTIRRADIASVYLLAVTVALGAAATALVPVLGRVITAGQYEISAVAVFGWAVYAAATASIMPYASLAAVRGKQATVMVYRLLEAAVALFGVAVLIVLSKSAAALVPYAMALGSFVGGASVRAFVLMPLGSSAGRHRSANRIRPISLPEYAIAVAGQRTAPTGSGQ